MICFLIYSKLLFEQFVVYPLVIDLKFSKQLNLSSIFCILCKFLTKNLRLWQRYQPWNKDSQVPTVEAHKNDIFTTGAMVFYYHLLTCVTDFLHFFLISIKNKTLPSLEPVTSCMLGGIASFLFSHLIAISLRFYERIGEVLNFLVTIFLSQLRLKWAYDVIFNVIIYLSIENDNFDYWK